jgi:3-oxoacid CoA-transferase
MVELGGEPIRLNKNGATFVASQPKESRIINGRKYLFEQAITGDYSFVKGWKGDTKGNVIFRESARNFNPDIAKAGKVCIVEVEELVPAGQLDPDQIHLPSVYVDYIL